MKSRYLLRNFAVLALCALPALAQSPGWQLRPGKPLATGPGPSTLAIADLNGDAHPDLLTGHQRLQKVAAWLGDGRGGFVDAPVGGILLTYEPGAFAAADLNGDARADVVIASSNDSGEYVQVFLNNGSGAFTSRRAPMIQLFPKDPYYKPLLHFADLNEDGKQDLLAGNGRREEIQILLGDGRGGLVKSSTLALHRMPGRYFLAVGDVDGDRHVDIVSAVGFADNRPSQVTVHLGDGAAHFRKGPTIEVDAASEGMRLILADMDADALPDLVLSHGRTLTVLRNAGSARFVRMAPPVGLPTDVFAPQAADLDGDGRLDIAVATVDSVSVLLNRPEGFRPAPGSPFPAGPGSYNVSLADLDHDGHSDVLTSSYEGNSVGLLFGR